MNRTLRVFTQGLIAFTKLGIGILLYRESPEKLNKIGLEFKDFFDDIGGVYIKFGQILSLRKDILPEEVCDELRALLDKVKPIPFDTVNMIINDELGNRAKDSIKKIEPTPLASASLGQVHLAELNTGEKVVIKVLRPNIIEITKHDVTLLRRLVRIIDLLPILNIKFGQIAEEFEEWIAEEVDYSNEIENLKEFEAFETKILPIFNIPLKTKIPKVYEELSTSKFITMEYIEGKTLNEFISARNIGSEEVEKLEIEGYSFKDIGKQFNLMTMKHVFLDGLFNADPHPANIIATKDGHLYFIDLGLIGRLNRSDRINIFRLGRAMALFDEETGYNAVLNLLNIEKVKDKEILKKAIADLMRTLKTGKSNKEINYAQASSKAMFNLFFIFNKHKIQVPPQIAKALRAVLTADGIVTSLNPEIEFDEAVQDMYRVTLAATYVEIKNSLNKENMLKTSLKAVNFLEENFFLD